MSASVKPAGRRPMTWRRLLIVLHRDIGYLAAGLTVIYALSGLAVNHVADWNPSYAIARETRSFAPLPDGTPRDQVVAYLARELALPGTPKNVFRPSPERIQVFYEGLTVEARPADGKATLERANTRPLLYEANVLHLNHVKRWWTWIADVYAVALTVLAVTGLFVLRGRQGLGGRGKWLVALGLAIPLLALFVLR